ncbi:MAG: nucleotide pyrophosphohydrolase, partial [Candidatus Marinimicrobia bacterium]|nr:nucleotide pyrophosphohydrolase [Candidatus Neomarinimicrobiota bacterium]
MVYLLRLCDVLGIDPVAAASEKMIKNGEKYPVEKARGNARKYTDL